MKKVTGYFKLVQPTKAEFADDSYRYVSEDGFTNYTHFPVLVHGANSRIQRYERFARMDDDIDVARALDTIADEMVGNITDEPMCLRVVFDENFSLTDDERSSRDNIVSIVKTALGYWIRLQELDLYLHQICRTMIKYGDAFYLKDPEDVKKRWVYLDPTRVKGAIIDKNNPQKVLGWVVDLDRIHVPFDKNRYAQQINNITLDKSVISTADCIIPAKCMIHFACSTLDEYPFGMSVLASVYSTFKKKELLEDAIVIYRIQRAPERLVFYIDVSDMNPARAAAYMKKIKDEVNQKRVPSTKGGTTNVESVYNPLSMLENYFFAQYSDGRGSRVDVLQSGQNLGELTELEYFQNKIFRGLRIPVSYMSFTETADKATVQDGKVGVVYVQELRFTMYVERLQRFVERVLDREFKRFLQLAQIDVDFHRFEVKLHEPSNFGIYRQQMLDADLLTAYSQADNVEYLSKRFILRRFLKLTEDEIVENERALAEEKGIDPDKATASDLYGVNIEGEEFVGGGFEAPSGGEESGGTSE